jgi:hypothetical protein
MASSALQKQVYEKLKNLSDIQLREVLLFIEFVNTRKDEEFIPYVNERTKLALKARKEGKKFHTLEELQKEFTMEKLNYGV